MILASFRFADSFEHLASRGLIWIHLQSTSILRHVGNRVVFVKSLSEHPEPLRSMGFDGFSKIGVPPHAPQGCFFNFVFHPSRSALGAPPQAAPGGFRKTKKKSAQF